MGADSQSAEDRLLPPLAGSVVVALGELVLDLVAVVGGPLPIGGQVDGTVVSRPGGFARNVTVAAAASKAKARFVGRTGDGPGASTLLASITGAGVDVRTLRSGRYSTSLCLQFVSGETTYITDECDADHLTADSVEESWFEDAAVVHLSGHDIYQARRTDVLERVLEIIERRKIPLTIDTALSNGLDGFGVDRFRTLLKSLEPLVLFCSEHEGDLLELDRVYPYGAGLVVQHRSMAPTKVFLPDVPPFKVPVDDTHRYGDTVGAGDAFAGGFLAAWVKQATVREAVESGHSAALHHLRALMHPAGRH